MDGILCRRKQVNISFQATNLRFLLSHRDETELCALCSLLKCTSPLQPTSKIAKLVFTFRYLRRLEFAICELFMSRRYERVPVFAGRDNELSYDYTTSIDRLIRSALEAVVMSLPRRLNACPWRPINWRRHAHKSAARAIGDVIAGYAAVVV